MQLLGHQLRRALNGLEALALFHHKRQQNNRNTMRLEAAGDENVMKVVPFPAANSVSEMLIEAFSGWTVSMSPLSRNLEEIATDVGVYFVPAFDFRLAADELLVLLARDTDGKPNPENVACEQRGV